MLVGAHAELHELAMDLRHLRHGGLRLGLGVVRWFRDEPADHPAVGQAERKYIESGRMAARPHPLDARRLGRILADRNVIALCLMYFTQAYGFYFNITWLPTYLAEARGFTDPLLGLLAGLPLILSAVADLHGGLTTDRLVRAPGA